MDVKDILAKMTLEEKAALVAGTDFMYTNPIPRLGVRSVRMADGPHGLRAQRSTEDNGIAMTEPATCFPTAVTLASTFNPDMALAMGEAIGEEALHYGVDVLLGPGINIKRNPLAGRNFEYFSEDPYLAGIMGKSHVSGVQKTGVGVSLKHFALNNSENYRFMGDSIADMRAVREIYLKPFEMTVKEAKPETLMCSYNKINGTYASKNKWLLTEVLRSEWGFQGLVMTDWGATHDRVDMLKAGLDLEMPGDNSICRKWICDGVKNGTLDVAILDKAVENVLKLVDKHEGRVKKNADFKAHNSLAESIAEDGAVLMKNSGTLPLAKNGEYLVVGELFEKPRYQGSGSSMVNSIELTTPKDAFDRGGISYKYAKGYRENQLDADLGLINEAVALTRDFDKVLLFVGLTDYVESEGCDREHMRLPENQLALIDAIIDTGKEVCIVSYGGSPYEMPFSDKVSAILNMYLPGQAGGDAAYSLIFGDVSPSGRLPETWPISYKDVPFGDSFSKSCNEVYRESIFVGYRYYTSASKQVRYPFGHGLSYTTFEYSDMSTELTDFGVKVKVTLKNTGTVTGGEVVQLYVGAPHSQIYKPDRELRAFKKVYLKPDEATRVELFVSFESLKYWNIKESRWVLEGGEYKLMISENAEKVLMEKSLMLDGEEAKLPYSQEAYDVYSAISLDKMTDRVFEEMSGINIPPLPPAKPITMESRFSNFNSTFMGRILYSAIISVAKNDMKKAKKLPDGIERDNKIKAAIFLERVLDSNSLTTMSMSSSNQCPYNIAEGLMNLANGRIFKGLKCFLTKINAPALPKENDNEK